MGTERRGGQAHLQDPNVQHKGWWKMQSPHVLLLLSSALCCVHIPVGEAGHLVFTYVVQSSEPPAHPPASTSGTFLPWVSPLTGTSRSKRHRLPQPQSFLFHHWSQKQVWFPNFGLERGFLVLSDLWLWPCCFGVMTWINLSSLHGN